MKDNLSKQLDIIYALQQKYSDLHVGGSIGLMLHGIKLSRPISYGDIDLCKAIDNINKSNDKIDKSGSFECDFDYKFEHEGIAIDLRIDADQKFDELYYKGRNYRVSKVKTIVEFKRKYASKGYEKHANDIADIENHLWANA
jgi:hypothetical protein